jgi:tetratricopeptide (TPR) repeat protein
LARQRIPFTDEISSGTDEGEDNSAWTVIMTNNKKPRLVFFQFRYDHNLPAFLLTHARDHVRCLSQFFDVTVVNEDCDFAKVCDEVEPDLALFETGVNHLTCRRLTITNVHSNPAVPRLGLHNADAFCIARSGFLSDWDHWKFDAAFAIATTAAEHTPEIAEQLFVWPNCIDPGTYRDYGERKNIPVLFTGNTNSLYPWRRKIQKLVSERHPSLICPHSGYAGGSNTHILHGEPYARLINASVIAPACGTVANEVVRKHFEIPACNTCLVAERTAALEAAGFIDMQNCVFADEHDVLDKLDYLFRNRDQLQEITSRGHQLVHAQHTYVNRDQIYQWYELRRQQQPNQRIVQSNPFGGLELVDTSTEIRSSHVNGAGRHLALLSRGNELLRTGHYDDAEAAFTKCLNYIGWMPEPKLGIALCRLQKGDPGTAADLLSEQIEFTLASYGAADPDPVEWAYYVIALLCQGKVGTAAKCAGQFNWLAHPVLDRARRVVAVLQHGAAEWKAQAYKRRHSIHVVTDQGYEEWLGQICRMLRACDRSELADRLLESTKASRPLDPDAAGEEIKVTEEQARGSDGYPVRQFRDRYRRRKSRLSIKRAIGRSAHFLERKYGYFLPYRLSEKKRDQFFSQIAAIGSQQGITRALVIGVPPSPGSLEALLSGMSGDDAPPQVLCVDRPTRRFRQLERRFAGNLVFRELGAGPEAEMRESLEKLTKMDGRGGVGAFELVLVNGTSASVLGLTSGSLRPYLTGARVVVLDDINNLVAHESLSALVAAGTHQVAAHDPDLRGGYTILKRTANASQRVATAVTSGVTT